MYDINLCPVEVDSVISTLSLIFCTLFRNKGNIKNFTKFMITNNIARNINQLTLQFKMSVINNVSLPTSHNISRTYIRNYDHWYLKINYKIILHKSNLTKKRADTSYDIIEFLSNLNTLLSKLSLWIPTVWYNFLENPKSLKFTNKQLDSRSFGKT